MLKILCATGNLSKIKRYKNFFQSAPEYTFLTCKDLGIKKPEVEENGLSELANAKLKAKAYFDILVESNITSPGKNLRLMASSRYLSLGADTGLYLQGLPPEKQPGRFVNRVPNLSSGLSPEEKCKKIVEYYKNLASDFGGKLSGYFLDTYAVWDGSVWCAATAKRNIELTSLEHELKKYDLPICSLYTVNGIPYYNLSPEDKRKFLEPSLDALDKCLWVYTV